MKTPDICVRQSVHFCIYATTFILHMQSRTLLDVKHLPRPRKSDIWRLGERPLGGMRFMTASCMSVPESCTADPADPLKRANPIRADYAREASW
jgi:hypothetical protein